MTSPDGTTMIGVGVSKLRPVSFRRHPWWRPHTRLEKVLIGVFIVLFILVIALIVALIILLTAGLNRQRKTCDSRSCIEAAAMIMGNMDDSKDPCNDFYDYACGRFVKQRIIPEDQSSINTFESIDKRIQSLMRQIFQETLPSDYNNATYFQLTQDMYSSCMDIKTLEELNEQPLVDLLNSVGGWPVVEGDQWKEDSFEWNTTVFQFRDRGVYMNYLIDISVVKDLKNSSQFILQVDQPSLGMPDRSYLLQGFDDPLVQAYYKLMVDMAVLLGADRTLAENDMKKALEFETKLAKFSLPLEDLRNFTKLYNRMSAAELNSLAPEVDWIAYLNNLQLPKNITEDEPIIVVVPSYVQKFADLVTTAEKRTVANFLMWRTVNALSKLLDRRFKSLLWEYTKILTGEEIAPGRPYYCTDVVFENMDVAVGAIYIRTHFRPESKVEATDIVKRVREEFYKRLNNLDWLDEETLEKAKEKARAMIDHIAYPEELLDDDKVNGFYENLSINRSEYFQNILRLNKFTSDNYLNRLNQTVEETQWISLGSAAVVNAYYKFSENSMIFFAGILNGAFFGADRPKYLNYGSMGFIVAHEITHGFDDMGRQYDHDGNLANWWGEETDRKFQEMAQCIIDQYGNYTMAEVNMNVNGILTQGENIADVGAAKEAYAAYETWEKEHGSEPVLPGLQLNARQLFWLSNANVWCSKERPAYLKLELNTNPHSPSRFRVNGPVSNSPHFAKDFNCPLGSPMNPKEKCAVW